VNPVGTSVPLFISFDPIFVRIDTGCFLLAAGSYGSSKARSQDGEAHRHDRKVRKHGEAGMFG